MQKCFFVPFSMLFLLLLVPINADQTAPLTVNIISHSLNNGAGKQVDVTIIKEELEKLGHRVNLFDYFKVDRVAPADINLFLAQFKSNWFSQAKLNWFIPNAENCFASQSELKKFDLVLSKTEEAVRIFKPICTEVYYLGFTSIDRYQPNQAKNFNDCLHVAGKSHLKGTESILKAWETPGLPPLTVIYHRKLKRDMLIPENVTLINQKISSEKLISLQNNCGIHLCPSKAEGFGHYIMEAMSTEAVVITTDAPPMNEFIKDQRCRVIYNQFEKEYYATAYSVDDQILADTVKELQELSIEELQRIGHLNRLEYLRRTDEFKQNFKRLMKKAVQQLSAVE